MKEPKLQTLSKHPDGPLWHSAIGRVVVGFGTLERVLLSWADVFAPNAKLLRLHHKDDMKQIGPALKRVIESRRSRLQKAEYAEAMASIAEAELLTKDRNDAAHGWLEVLGDKPNGPIGFFVAKRDARPQRVFGVRDIEWLNGVASRILDATNRSHAVMTAIARSGVFS